MSVWYSDLKMMTLLQIANSLECTLEMEASPHCFLISQHKWSSLSSSRWAQNCSCLEIKQISSIHPWGKAPEQGNVKGLSGQGRHPLPLALGCTSWQMKLCANAGQIKMVLRQPQCCLVKKERKHLQILSWCWAGIACCFSSWAHGRPAPDWSEWFPETNVFEIYFLPPKEILVFSHPYYMGWVSKLCFNHNCFQMVS